MTDRTVDLQHAIHAQQMMRAELGLGEERFPVAAFIGMVSDEIEQLRAAGRDNAAIAALVTRHAGLAITATDIADHYAPPERRGRG